MGFLVGVYQEKKDYPDAIDLAKKMVALEPRTINSVSLWARSTTGTNKKSWASTRCARRSSSIPSNAPALNYLGYTYAESGKHLDEAEKLIKRALDIEPEDGFYVDSLGWVYYQQGRVPEGGRPSSNARST